jgi:hypothetical protein
VNGNHRRLPYLTSTDIVRLWTEERRRKDPHAPPISMRTLYAYYWFTQPLPEGKNTNPDGTYRANRYEDHPFPGTSVRPGQQERQYWPDEGQSVAHLEQAFRDWWNDAENRPGRGGDQRSNPDTEGEPA